MDEILLNMIGSSHPACSPVESRGSWCSCVNWTGVRGKVYFHNSFACRMRTEELVYVFESCIVCRIYSIKRKAIISYVEFRGVR